MGLIKRHGTNGRLVGCGLIAILLSGCSSRVDSTATENATDSTDGDAVAVESQLREQDGRQAVEPTNAPKPQAASSDATQPNDSPPKNAASVTPVSDAEVITFDDLNLQMPIDVRFRPFMLTGRRAEELLGKRVNLAGYINPTDRLKGIDDFILLRNLQCKFGPGGQADHLVHVIMQDDATTDFTDRVVYVEGELVLNPFHSPDGSATWSIYDLKADRVSLDPPPRRR